MNLEEAVFIGLEDEGEGVQRQRRAEPDESVRPPVQMRPEGFLPALAHQAVDAVGADQQVAVAAQRLEILLLVLKMQLHAVVAAALLQDLQQLLARQTAEAVPAGADALAASH